MRTFAQDTVNNVGETVTLKGWVNSRRDHGGLIFIDVRDHTGVAQLAIRPEQAEAFARGEQLRDEFVISATGTVVEREEGLRNPNIATGGVEVKVDALTILNRSEPLPIQVMGETMANEDLRLKYRYLDLRRPKMQDMLKKRADMYQRMRAYMDAHEFTEITTPILANSSPEGARDFLIPSRLQAGKFYALPQAPQQFKQLLMVGGVPRYYQLAACFRDEDPRSDRLYGEFYQLDLEMAFAEDGEEVRAVVEPLIKQLATDFAGKKLLSEDIPRIPYLEAMERYGSDKPDLRYEMELTELTEELKNTEFGVFKNALKEGGVIKAIAVPCRHHMFSRKEIDEFTEIAKKEGAGGLPSVTYEAGGFRGGIAKFLSSAESATLEQKLQLDAGEDYGIFFASDNRRVANKVLGKLRAYLADRQELKDPNVIALAWIVDFPFYETDEKTGKLDFGHNPFSMPKGGLAALKREDKTAIIADQYDMVMNGYEICSGGVRNHNPEILYKVFDVLGFDKAYVDERFGAMISAFKYGAPPHAGCAFGVDRMLMELTGESNVREVVAFPKNGSGVDVMMNSPSTVDVAQTDELNLRIIEH
ncbi:MAG TPA: aspartate--tRNA ligase [Candidatus Saccharimonadales bacterium]|nr:aspartate--tRNA ligase [Candidatus Saccharimonadales bacterium]